MADHSAPARVRRAFRSWLRDMRWPTDQVDDLVLAVDEAVTNVVEHAYPSGDGDGSAAVSAGFVVAPGGREQVIVVVADHGVWQTVGSRVHHPRGLRLMRSCTHALHIQRATGGTKIMMASRPLA